MAPELQADIVSVNLNPGSVAFFSVTNTVNVSVTAGGSTLGGFMQWNDPYGKTLFSATFGNIGSVQYSQVLNASTPLFGNLDSINTTNAPYIGFRTAGGNVGWFSVNWGDSGDAITYGSGQFGNAGESVHVGVFIPEPTSSFALAGLALGAVGLRHGIGAGARARPAGRAGGRP